MSTQPADGPEIPTVLFVCNHNAGRSAMAAALARRQAGVRAIILSAGLNPADTASEGTIESLAEVGIDDTAHIPTKLTEPMVAASTIVVAMKPSLDIPQVGGVVYETWDLPNPQGWQAPAIRPLRDRIDAQVADLLRRLLVN